MKVEQKDVTFVLHLRSRYANDIRASVSRRALLTYSVFMRGHDDKLADSLLDTLGKEVVYERELRGGKELDDVAALDIINLQQGIDKALRKKKEAENDEKGSSTSDGPKNR